MSILYDYDEKQLGVLLGNPTAAQVHQLVVCKILKESQSGSERPCASFWRSGENWISEEKLIESLELLLSEKLIGEFSTGSLTIIVSLQSGDKK